MSKISTETIRREEAGVQVNTYPPSEWDYERAKNLTPIHSLGLTAQVIFNLSVPGDSGGRADILRYYTAAELRAIAAILLNGAHTLEADECALICEPRRDEGDSYSHWLPCSTARLIQEHEADERVSA